MCNRRLLEYGGSNPVCCYNREFSTPFPKIVVEFVTIGKTTLSYIASGHGSEELSVRRIGQKGARYKLFPRNRYDFP